MLALIVIAIAVAFACYLFAAISVYAQDTQVLVSNHGESRDGVIHLRSSEQGVGQAFTTGSDGGAYWLDTIVVRIQRGFESRFIDLAGQLHEVNSDGSRGAKLTNLSHTGVHINFEDYVFTAPADTLLLPDTTYMMVIRCTAGCANDNYLQFAVTFSDNEDGDGESDWAIEDYAVRASDDWSPNASYDASLVMKVNGRYANKPYIVDDGVTIASTPADANSYGSGEVIAVEVEFSSRVVLDMRYGLPELMIEMGDGSNPAREQPVEYTGGSDTDTLRFEYVVQPSDRDGDGIEIPAGSLILNDSTIKGRDNGLGAFRDYEQVGASGGLPGHKVDGSRTTPTVRLTSLELAGVTLSPDFAPDMETYVALVRWNVGETTVTATPDAGGSVSVSPEDSDSDSMGHQVALDDGDNEITVTVTKPDSIPTTYNLTVARQEREQPRVKDISIISVPHQGNVYGRGETVIFQVTFNTPVAVDTSGGRPKLPVEYRLAVGINDDIWLYWSTENYQYAGGSGSEALRFERVVKRNDHVLDKRLGMQYRASRLATNGGWIRHATNGRDASLRHRGSGIIGGHRVNGSTNRSFAKLNSLSLSGLTLSPSFDTDTIYYTAEAPGDLSVTTLSTDFDEGLMVTVDPADSDSGTAGHQVALSEGLNEISVTASQDDSAPRTYTIEVNRLPAPPMVSGITIASDPGTDGTYAAGDTIKVNVAFDAAVEVDTTNGTPYLPLTIGSNARNAAYTSIDGTNRVLTFAYTVVSADNDQNGVSIAANGLNLNGGAIKEQGTTTDASLTHAALDDQSGHVVNKVPKIVSDGVLITSTPADSDTYLAGEIISFSVTFDSEVVVDTTNGAPRLVVRMGDPDHPATNKHFLYVRGSASSTLEFEYTVQAGDRDANGLYVRPNQLQLNGGAIKHATTGRDANLNHPKPGQNGDFPNHKVDGGPVATSNPPKPANLAAQGQDGAVRLSWDAPPSTAVVTHHEYRHKESTETAYPATWTEISDSGHGEANEVEFTVTPLTNGLRYDFQVRAVNAVGPSGPSDAASALAGDGLGICNRTLGVQVAILSQIPGIDDCADVTASHLAQIASVTVRELAGGLLAGDFAGLSAATAISVQDSPNLTELPAGIFTGLSSVSTMHLTGNRLAELPAGVLDDVVALVELDLGDNQLAELPDGVFDQLTALKRLRLNDNQLTTLPQGIFLALTKVKDIRLDGNRLTSLPFGVLDNAPLLSSLRLDGNRLTDLPNWIFAGKTSLERLQLEGNVVDPMLLAVSAEQTVGLQFKAAVLTGAPFDITLPVVVTDGTLVGGASAITIGIGQTQSPIAGVTRAPGATGNPMIDFGTLPDPPSDHSGYRLSKSADLPLALATSVISSIALSSDAGSDGTYATGDAITVLVTFEEAVTVNTSNGTPYIPLTIGVTARNADYASIDSTNRMLTFSYVVVAADSDQDGVSIVANGLVLGGGAIKVLGTDSNAVLGHAELSAQSDHLVNKIPQIVSDGVAIASTPRATADTYILGETIAFSVTFDSDVVVDTTNGTPRLGMTFEDANNVATDRYLEYARGSGGATLVFEYVVQAADGDGNGLFVGASQLELNGGTIKHSSTGKDASLDHPAPAQSGDFPDHKVDGTLTIAMLTELSLSGMTLSPSFTAGTFAYSATVGRDVEQTTVTATAETGATETILPADSDTGTTGHQVDLNRGANEITITVARSGALNGVYSVTANRLWAEIESVSFTSDPGPHNSYATDDVITVAVTFDAPVTVDTTDGTPYIEIVVGNYYRNAIYTSIDAANRALTFSYTVIAGDSDQGGIEIEADALNLDGGSIKREGTDLDAFITHDALPEDSGHLVNKTPRIVSNGVTVTSTPRATSDTYGFEETIVFSVTFDSPVVVDTTGGQPTLVMRFSDPDNPASDKPLQFARGSGTATLEFEYVVRQDDRDSNGLGMHPNRLELNGSTIKHVTTQRDAILTYPRPGQNGRFPNHKVDGSMGGIRPIVLCGARVGSAQELTHDAELDLCWDVGITVPSGDDVIIELRTKGFWYDGDPFARWRQVAHGDDYTPCTSGVNSCVKHTVKELLRGEPRTYELRMRRGSKLLAGSSHLYTHAPNSNGAELNAKLSGCYPMDGEIKHCGRATGRFWMDLEFTDPTTMVLTTEIVNGLETSDFEITNGIVAAVELGPDHLYRVVIDPITLGQPITIRLPAATVLGVGEGITSDGRNNYTRSNTASNRVTVRTKAP